MRNLNFKNPFPVLIALGLLSLAACRQTTVSVSVDGSRLLQQIDGFGVNANTASWGDTKLIPAIDLLVDSLHLKMTIITRLYLTGLITTDYTKPPSFRKHGT